MNRHAALRHHQIENGRLLIGGKPVSHWAETLGTPLYLYDRQLIARRVAELRALLPIGLSLHYAIKANPYPPLVELMAGLVDGMDVASHSELQLALNADIRSDRISFAGPGKRDPELREAVLAGVILSVESPGELERIAAIAAQTGTRPRVALRINPAFRLRASGMHMGGGPSPFGIDEEQLPALLKRLRALPLELVGLHVFAGSQNLSADHLAASQAAIFDLAERLLPQLPGALRWLNIGGGLGIPYFDGDRPLDLPRLALSLSQRLRRFRERAPECEVVLELGRYLVGEAGIYVTRVLERKRSRGKTYLITDGGMHHHLAASGNFGQVLRRNFPLVAPDRMDEAATESVEVTGPLCTPLDRLGSEVALPHLEAGDLVAILQSGAYGLSASPTAFLGHPLPGEHLV